MEIKDFIKNIILKRIREIFDYKTDDYKIIFINSYQKRAEYKLNLTEITSFCIYNNDDILKCVIFIFYELFSNDLYIESGNNFEDIKKQKIKKIISKKNIKKELEILFWFYNKKNINWHDILEAKSNNNLIKLNNIFNQQNDKIILNNTLLGPYYNIYYKRYEKTLKNKNLNFKDIINYVEKNYLKKKKKLEYNQGLALVKNNKGWSLRIGKKISINNDKKNLMNELNIKYITYFISIN